MTLTEAPRENLALMVEFTRMPASDQPEITAAATAVIEERRYRRSVLTDYEQALQRSVPTTLPSFEPSPVYLPKGQGKTVDEHSSAYERELLTGLPPETRYRRLAVLQTFGIPLNTDGAAVVTGLRQLHGTKILYTRSQTHEGLYYLRKAYKRPQGKTLLAESLVHAATFTDMRKYANGTFWKKGTTKAPAHR